MASSLPAPAGIPSCDGLYRLGTIIRNKLLFPQVALVMHFCRSTRKVTDMRAQMQ